MNVDPGNCFSTATKMTFDIFGSIFGCLCSSIILALALNSKNPQGGPNGVGWFLWIVFASCVCGFINTVVDYFAQKSAYDKMCTGSPSSGPPTPSSGPPTPSSGPPTRDGHLIA